MATKRAKTDSSAKSVTTTAKPEKRAAANEPVLDAIIGRALRDDGFRQHFLDDPLRAAEVAGYRLTTADRIALKTINQASARNFLEQFVRDPGLVMWSTDKRCYEFESDLGNLLRDRVINPGRGK